MITVYFPGGKEARCNLLMQKEQGRGRGSFGYFKDKRESISLEVTENYFLKQS